MYKYALFLLLPTLALAEKSVSIRGELISPKDQFPLTGYSVELTSPNNRAADYRAIVSSSGTFEIHSLPAGTYQVRILRDNRHVHTEFVTANTHSSLVQVQLPESTAGGARPASGTVSVHRLTHKPPKAALKEMKRAAKARQKGDIETSLAHLEKAVEIDPQFVEAQVNLGARYVEAKRMSDATAAFERAIKMDPHCTQAHANLALVFIQQQRAQDAERAARRAVDLDDGNVRAHYVLGYSLAMQDAASEEALKHFIRAAHEYPIARVGAAQILLERGQEQRAETELKAYLDSGDQTKRQVVQSFLAKLRD